MNEIIGFTGYAIENFSRIGKITRGDDSLADIVTRAAQVKKGRTAVITSASQKKIANIAFFFSLLYPAARGRRCFFSSLLIMSWAYTRGLTPKLNMGLRQGINDIEGHAWLSLDGSPFCERTALTENYKTKLSETGNLIYWYGEEPL
jgi:hypothetical protein